MDRMFDAFSKGMNEIFRDDEDDCHAKATATACNAASDKCSWCTAGAVADACHSIENARSLPSAVFDCSNLGGSMTEIEEDPVFSSFQNFIDSFKGGRHQNRNERRMPPPEEYEEDEEDEDEEEEERPWFGENGHGRRDHNGGRGH